MAEIDRTEYTLAGEVYDFIDRLRRFSDKVTGILFDVSWVKV